jgi:FMN phosphatase YigB (HAD superfamily)
MLKILLGGSFCFLSYSILSVYLSAFGSRMVGKNFLPTVINCSNLIIAVDLHGVLFHADGIQIIRTLCAMKNKRIALKYAFNPFFWLKLRKFFKETPVIEELFFKLTKAYPELMILKDDFIYLCNAQRLDEEIVFCLQELKKRGYILYILSNIGQETYDDLVIRYPSVISLFEGAFIPRSDNGYMHKPQITFYQSFKQHLTAQNYERESILLIDDSALKLRGAEKAAIAGILFQSPQKLFKTLKDIGCMR